MSTSPIVIRDAIIEDATLIAPLLGELGYPSQPDGVRARLARLLAREDSRVFVAERAARVLGVLGLHRMPVLTSPSDIAMIIALVVTERARRSGVGRLLVARAEDEARVWRCGRIMVRAPNAAPTPTRSTSTSATTTPAGGSRRRSDRENRHPRALPGRSAPGSEHRSAP
jgi:N-acetylglutamate synthase-like GNAT family acetyltransferase